MHLQERDGARSQSALSASIPPTGAAASWSLLGWTDVLYLNWASESRLFGCQSSTIGYHHTLADANRLVVVQEKTYHTPLFISPLAIRSYAKHIYSWFRHLSVSPGFCEALGPLRWTWLDYLTNRSLRDVMTVITYTSAVWLNSYRRLGIANTRSVMLPLCVAFRYQR